MSIKIKITLVCLAIIIILFSTYQIFIEPRDDVQIIQKAVYSLNHPNTKIAHIIEMDNNTKAIVFYEWGYGTTQQFGFVSLEKNFFIWEITEGSTIQTPFKSKLGLSQSFFPFQGEYPELLYGKIFDPKITQVVIKENNKKYIANIIKYDSGERFWFFIPNTKLLGYTVTGFSKDGEIIEKIPK